MGSRQCSEGPRCHTVGALECDKSHLGGNHAGVAGLLPCVASNRRMTWTMPYVSVWGALFWVLGLSLLLRRPGWSARKRGLPLVGFIGIGWVLLNLGVHAYWGYRVDTAFATPGVTDEELRTATADGANLVFTLLFGWAAAAAFAGIIEAIWQGGCRWLLRLPPPRDGATLFGRLLVGWSVLSGLLLAASYFLG